MGTGFRLRSAQARVFAETFLVAASKTRIRRISPTRSLRIEQSSSHQEQIRERGGRLEPVQVLRQAPVTYFLKAEDPLDDSEHVLNLGAHAGLAAVGRLDRFVDALSPSVALVREVLRMRRTGADRCPLPFVGLVTPDASFLAVQQILQRVAIGDVGRRGQHRVHELRPAVDSDVRLHAEKPLFSLRRLMHLRVALALFVLRRTRCTDDGRIDNRPGRDLDAAASEVLVHTHQQLLSQFVFLQQMAKFAYRGLIRRSFHSQVNADEVTHGHRVVQRFLDRRIRQVEPQLQEIDPQHPLQRQRRPASCLANFWIKRLNDRRQLRPGHDHLHIGEKLRASRRLAVSLESRQCLLLHHPVRARVVVAISDTVGNSEFP